MEAEMRATHCVQESGEKRGGEGGETEAASVLDGASALCL